MFAQRELRELPTYRGSARLAASCSASLVRKRTDGYSFRQHGAAQSGVLEEDMTEATFKIGEHVSWTSAVGTSAARSLRSIGEMSNTRGVVDRVSASKEPSMTELPVPDTLSPQLLGRMNGYWRAANYLSVGQIYLRDNPLLEAPLKREHLKPRLLGHWGTTPGLNFLYVHLNRLIKEHDLDMMYVIGPGHGAPGVVAQHVSGRLLHRDLSKHRAQSQWPEKALSPVFLALRHPEPCRARDSRIDP